MANEIQLKLGTFQLDSGQTYSISSIDFDESKTITVHNIPKTDGTITETGRRGAMNISLKGTVGSTNYDALRTALDALKMALQAGIQKFTIDDDRYIMAQLKSFKKSFVTLRTLAEFQANFVAHYPFWLSETEHTDDRYPTSLSGYVINNAGNAPARCKIKVTSHSGGTIDNVRIENQTNGKIFRYRGTLGSFGVLIVDNRYTTDDFAVTKNGVDDIVNFEGDFITLEGGDNTIILTGDVGTNVQITHKDCWY
jgi:hypothetical protein